MQCTAEAVAVHCGSGCSALRLRWAKLAQKPSVLFWIRELGGETHPIRLAVAPLDTSADPLHHTQGDALGYVLVAPSGRALNACAYSLIQLAKLEYKRI